MKIDGEVELRVNGSVKMSVRDLEFAVKKRLLTEPAPIYARSIDLPKGIVEMDLGDIRKAIEKELGKAATKVTMQAIRHTPDGLVVDIIWQPEGVFSLDGILRLYDGLTEEERFEARARGAVHELKKLARRRRMARKKRRGFA